MALRFVDSFDHYVTADLAEKWTTVTGTPTISAGNGRRGTACLRTNAQAQHVTKTLDAQATWIVGVAIKLTNAVTGTVMPFIQLVDASTVQTDVRINNDGTISVTRNGTTLGTSTFALSAGVFYYIEFKCLINNSTGTYEVRVDGSNKVSGTGADTQSSANASANQVRVGYVSSSGSPDPDIDDVYICDATGSTNNDFLGDCRVDYYGPNGNGNTSQLTGSDGNSTDNYLLVDEAAPNDDTDYVESATVGNKDTYALADMTHTPTSIFGIQVLASAKKDDAGARSIATVTRSGTTDFDGATQALSTSYIYYSDVREVDPNTSAAWTKANFNSSEPGVKVAA